MEKIEEERRPVGFFAFFLLFSTCMQMGQVRSSRNHLTRIGLINSSRSPLPPHIFIYIHIPMFMCMLISICITLKSRSL